MTEVIRSLSIGSAGLVFRTTQNGTLIVEVQAGGLPVDDVDLTSDNIALTTGLATGSVDLGFDGTNFDRIRTNGAAVLASATQPFAKLVANPGEWSVFHTPAVNVKATCSRGSGGAGVINVCRSISAALSGLSTAAESFLTLNLIDGASGGGAILWAMTLHAIPAGTTGIAIAGLNIPGSANTVMTLEFAAAGGADTVESVALTGYSTV